MFGGVWDSPSLCSLPKRGSRPTHCKNALSNERKRGCRQPQSTLTEYDRLAIDTIATVHNQSVVGGARFVGDVHERLLLLLLREAVREPQNAGCSRCAGKWGEVNVSGWVNVVKVRHRLPKLKVMMGSLRKGGKQCFGRGSNGAANRGPAYFVRHTSSSLLIKTIGHHDRIAGKQKAHGKPKLSK